MKCKNCGDPIPAIRVEAGYDYCVKEECQRRCVKRVRLAAVGVNKAADYYAKAEELLPPPAPSPTISPEEPDETPAVVGSQRSSLAKPRVKGTLERLRERETELDAALDANYQRFFRAEITAREMDRERERLIRAFNLLVLAENIRYRGMLRK